MDMNMLHPTEQLVMIMERIYKYGMTTTSGGNLSILDDNGDMWITPGGVDKGNLTNKDMVCVKKDGTILGAHKPSSEYLFHRSVYEARPDIKSVLHAHPPALVAFSIVRKLPNTRLIPNVHVLCGKIGMAEYGLPGSQDLGDKIGKVFQEGKDTVILENHGIVVGGKSLFDAFQSFETLDFCARLEIDANQIGVPRLLTDQGIELSKGKSHIDMDEFVPKYFSSMERAARREMCDLIHRAYDQQLFTSTQGTFSQRIDKNAFIITPYAKDRKYLDVGDLVRIEGNYKEMGKVPSRSVTLHKAIYEKHPEINSIIIAHPPNVMAFVVTDQVLDSKTIPESYILLRSIPKLEFGSSFIDPENTAEKFSSSTPIVMVNNDCIIVTGSSLLNAFDRLEVAEYSAKAIIVSVSLGNIVSINEEQISDIKEAFHLD